MSDFDLAVESIEEIIDYAVLTSRFENGAEQRRLKHTNPIIGFRITSPTLTKTQMQAYRAVFTAKYGALTSFTYTSPFDDTEYTVRFSEGSFKTVYRDGVFQCSFEFEVLP